LWVGEIARRRDDPIESQRKDSVRCDDKEIRAALLDVRVTGRRHDDPIAAQTFGDNLTIDEHKAMALPEFFLKLYGLRSIGRRL
jgi:hypothetical protein